MREITSEQRRTLTRWRLVLGKTAESHGIELGGEDRRRMQTMNAKR
jgi:hypothetical protein